MERIKQINKCDKCKSRFLCLTNNKEDCDVAEIIIGSNVSTKGIKIRLISAKKMKFEGSKGEFEKAAKDFYKFINNYCATGFLDYLILELLKDDVRITNLKDMARRKGIVI